MTAGLLAESVELQRSSHCLLAGELAGVETRLRYERWFLPLSVPLGLGPRHSEVRSEADCLHVRTGWAFTADIQLSSIQSAGPSGWPVLGWGVHGFGGDWLVNRSSEGIVELIIDPPVRARVIGVPTTLRRLRISVADPMPDPGREPAVV